MTNNLDLRIDGWRIDIAARIATRNGQIKHLSPRAIRLLSIFADSPGKTFSREELLDRIWPNVVVSDESLSQVVSEIRRTLANRGIIATVSRGGYRLEAAAFASIGPVANQTEQRHESLTDLEAHAICLEARQELVRCGRGAIERAEELTAHAVDLAPGSSMVQSERAIALVRSHLYWSEGRMLLDSALDHAACAVELDPTSAKANSCLGYAHATAGHWAAADIAHQRAIALAPFDASGYHLAAWYLMTRRKEQAAIAFFERVGDLEPGNIKGYLHAAQLAYRFDPARSRRNAERALRRARERLETDPHDMRALAATGLVMALLDEPSSAYATVQGADTSGSAQAIYAASTLALLGETSRALSKIEELFDHGWRDMPWLAVDPAFIRISDHSRFQRLCSGQRAA
ncbi:MAG: winged helix-turn-helix domain-containing protein [Pseudomonadota bacterium]